METTREHIAKDPEYRFYGKMCRKCGGRIWYHPKGFPEICENFGNGCDHHIVGG